MRRASQKPSNFADPGNFLEVTVKVLPGLSVGVSVLKETATPRTIAASVEEHFGTSLEPDDFAPNLGGRIINWDEDLSDCKNDMVLRFLVGNYSGA